MNRRQFVTTLAAAGSAACLAACRDAAVLSAPASAPVPAAGSDPALRAALELEGRFAGWANAYGATEIATRGVPDYVPGHGLPPPSTRHVFRDLVIEASDAMAPGFYAWATGCLGPDAAAETRGAIVTVDARGREIARRAWRGRVDRLRLPALARNDCAPAALRVQVAIAEAAPQTPRPLRWAAPAPRPDWRRCDFQLQIDGGILHAAAISAFACSRRNRAAASGGIALPPELSPLALTLPPVEAAALERRVGERETRARLLFLRADRRPWLALRLTGALRFPAPSRASFAILAADLTFLG
ncbi:MAG TPA: hypothetical protein VE996_09750 [Terriglobales bacterium]|nr:hypothetical protein [Terriglobales bacterium]